MAAQPEKMVTPMTAAPAKKVEVTDLRLRYGDREVIHGISFHIEPNEILGIIGPAQSGKTSPSTRMVPVTRAPAVNSMVRLMQRSSEVFPLCAGPMMPRISFGSM